MKDFFKGIIFLEIAFINSAVIEFNADKGTATPAVAFLVTENDIGRLGRLAVIAADFGHHGDFI